MQETGNNISVCTYNGYQDVDRELHLDEICGKVTVTETVVNVLECDVTLTDIPGRGIGPVETIGLGRPIIPTHAGGEVIDWIQTLFLLIL